MCSRWPAPISAQLESSLRAEGIDSPLDVMKSNGGTSTFRRFGASSRSIWSSRDRSAASSARRRRRSDRRAEPDHPRHRRHDREVLADRTRRCTRSRPTTASSATHRYAGYPIKVPVVDIVEIGAGGGSIAWIDAGGALKVGPRSAGAVPGPACYGQAAPSRPSPTPT